MSPNNEVLKFLKTKERLRYRLYPLRQPFFCFFSALPLFTAGSDSQKAGATCATAEKSATQPVNAGNAAIAGTVGALSDYCGTTEYNAEKRRRKGEEKSAAAKKGATAEKGGAQPVNAGNAAFSGTAAQTKNTTAEKAVPPSAVREVF